MIQVYVCSIYFWTAIHKLYSRDWLQATAVANALKSPMWSRNPRTGLLRQTWMLRAAAVGTLCFEFFAPLALFAAELSITVMVLGVALHVGIWRGLRIGYFSPLMIAAILSFGGPIFSWLAR